jgi:hypothetical protein
MRADSAATRPASASMSWRVMRPTGVVLAPWTVDSLADVGDGGSGCAGGAAAPDEAERASEPRSSLTLRTSGDASVACTSLLAEGRSAADNENIICEYGTAKGAPPLDAIVAMLRSKFEISDEPTVMLRDRQIATKTKKKKGRVNKYTGVKTIPKKNRTRGAARH